MKQKTITFTINDDLKTTVEADGFEGNACSTDVNALMDGIGKVKRRRAKTTTAVVKKQETGK